MQCDLCRRYVQRNCSLLTRIEYSDLTDNFVSWSCQICNENIFPFNHIIDDTEFMFALYELQLNRSQGHTRNTQSIAFDPFEINDNDYDPPLSDIDPDSAFFREHAHYLNSSSNYYSEDLFNRKIRHREYQSDCLSMVHLNIKSISSKISNFVAYLENLDLSFSIIALSETWLTQDNKDCYGIPGYNHVALPRHGRIGGGVSLFLNENIEYKELHASTSEASIEALFVEITLHNKKYVVGVVYHPPNTNIRTFTEILSEKLDIINSNNLPTYLLGDYNADLLKYDLHKPTAGFLDMMFAHSFIPLINRPTRITDETSTLIDNIYTNVLNLNNCTMQGILSPNISDHEAIFHLHYMQNNERNVQDEYILIRKRGDKNYQQYSNEVNNFDWDKVNQYNTCQSAFTFFSTTLRGIYNKAFPVTKVKKRYKNRLPWLTPGLKTSIKYKNRWYKTQVQHPTVQNKCNYRQYRNKLQYLMKCEEKIYYKNLIEQNKTNLTKTWRIIKEVINKHKSGRQIKQFMHNGEIITNKTEIATCFNNFFVNIGPSLASKITGNIPDFKKYLPASNPHSIFLQPVTCNEISKIIISAKEGSPGWDEINAKSVKCISNVILSALCHICNLSLEEGVFPRELKITKVVPIYKSNDAMSFTNYRPISLLSIFSQILEKVMYKRLIQFINAHNLLYKFQFGFRQNHSTYMPLIIIIDKITQALDQGNYVIGIFFRLP